MTNAATTAFDPAGLEEEFSVIAAGHEIGLQSHRMVFNPTAFGLNLAPLVAQRVARGATVCEIGTGSGVLCILAGRLGADVTGLDINPSAVEMTRRNWQRNQLPTDRGHFYHSAGFAALEGSKRERERRRAGFDLIWSNPPLLPRIDSAGPAKQNRDDFEVAGETGRAVLDTILTAAGPWLRPDGRVLTIATSLQGWAETERLLEKHWERYRVLVERELELTDECGPAYIDWWLSQDAADARANALANAEPRVYERDGKWLHKVWFLEAEGTRTT